MNGWVKFHRQIVDWRWYQDANTFRLFFHLVLTANHEPKEWMKITIDRGQRVTSQPKLAAELGLSISQIRTALRNLQLTGEIVLKATRHYSIVTVCNYAIYQAKDDDIDGTDDRQIADTSQTHRRHIATNKNDKNDKNSITTPLPPSTKPGKEAYADYVTMTADEHAKLIARLGEDGTQFCIDKLSAYKGASGKKYKSDYQAILNWGVERWDEEKKRRGADGNQGAGIKPIGYYEHHEDSDYDRFCIN